MSVDEQMRCVLVVEEVTVAEVPGSSYGRARSWKWCAVRLDELECAAQKDAVIELECGAEDDDDLV